MVIKKQVYKRVRELRCGPVKGIENLNINDVASEIEVDNMSDDDVIEVVRDDAPIEILSDGEELELEKAKQGQQNSILDNFIVDNFHFSSLSSEIQPHANIQSDVDNNTCDPLNTDIAIGDPLSSLRLSPFHAVPPVHSTTNSAEELKSNQDESDESHYVNVTDLDQPDSWSTFVSGLSQQSCGQSDNNKEEPNTNPLISEHNNPQIESKPDNGNEVVDNPSEQNPSDKALVGHTSVADNTFEDKSADEKPINQVPEEKTIENDSEVK
ncbi:unnamed protein product [Arctia plantaginis]|uniref:Uncharacterized protein n=1 Tax=Arctia plantaginis TaxID=874455 RepID=A0A8S1AVR2_ARCPL|nr:unnamed protein product [Arctia plantaginis]